MKTIAVLTATRAEYGLLRPFIKALSDQGLKAQLLVTGMHLSGSFGLTVREIEADGAEVAAKIPILVDSDTPSGVSKTMALAMLGFSDYFAANRPDALLVLGDRYETLAVCCTALNERIPIIHLYGGETTEGAIDEAIRHAITKMSYLHLTSTDEYRKRVIQLGEHPDRVFNVGAIGIENALNLNLLSIDELGDSLGISLQKPYAVMTYHPVTLDDKELLADLNELLDVVASHPDITFLSTKANADAGGRAINMRLAEFAVDHPNLLLFDSLGSLRYLSAIASASFVIGNSSSGLLEAPAFLTPTINIGDRQRGRIKPESVIDCGEDATSIENALRTAMSSEFREQLIGMDNPYGDGHTSRKAARLIGDFLGGEIDLKKSFFDLECAAEDMNV